MPQKRRIRRQKRRGRGRPTRRGKGLGAALVGLPKAALKITKGLETLAKKRARKAHVKRMAEIRSDKRKQYAGESNTCSTK